MRSTVSQVIRKFLNAPNPQPEQMFTRIRLMERDIVLPIKVILIGLAYWYLNYFQIPDAASIQGNEIEKLITAMKEESIRNAFIAYLVFNFALAVTLVFMMSLPLSLVRWMVYSVIVIDSISAAIMVNLTGDIESLFYWIFLFIVVRNAVSVSQHRRQLTLYCVIILCYILGPVFNRTLDNLATKFRDQQALDQQPLPGPVSNEDTVDYSENGVAKLLREILEPVKEAIEPIFNPIRADDNPPKFEPVEPTLREAALTALLQVTDPAEWQDKFLRIVVLCLLSMCCYGISILWTYQVLIREEEQEFTARQNHLRSIGRLAAEIAHRLKNPLAIINNAAFSLGRALPHSPDNIHERIAMIKEEVEHSDRILTELMGYAKLAEGRVERLQLREEIDRAISQVFPPAFDQDVDVHVECPTEFPPMLMQENHLNEILVNLLINAREAILGDGWVEIEAERNAENRVTLTIRDSGDGLSEDRLEKIFEPYYSTKARGTGLGLAIVKHNVEIYGGTVVVESGLGKSTTFTLQFPFRVIVPLNT